MLMQVRLFVRWTLSDCHWGVINYKLNCMYRVYISAKGQRIFSVRIADAVLSHRRRPKTVDITPPNS